MNTEALFTPITLRSGHTLKNRVVMAPMTNYSSEEDGRVTASELAYYARRSGGVGMVVTACANVTDNGQGFTHQVSAHRDDLVPSLRELAARIQAQGAKAVLQIFHAGRLAPAELVDGDVVSASAVVSERPGSAEPRELTDAEVAGIVTAFADATRRAIEAGFDGVELHGANGYLIQQFFSPHSNRRTDRWGGDVQGRMAFPLAVVDAVQQAVKAHAARGGYVLGVCNGFQVLTESGLLPGALSRNREVHFMCRPVHLRVEHAGTAFTGAYRQGQVIEVPIAHGEGNYYADPDTISRLEANGQVVFRYVDNPNGSLNDIAGIISERGNVLGMMPHPERAVEALLGSEDGRGLFESLRAGVRA